jgi:guanosine-3',5'-bis(diphosphate) 3'-pyrophosphohydrolase
MDVATTEFELVRGAFEKLEPSDVHVASFDSLLEACRVNLPSVDEEMLRKAFLLSNWAHRQDKRASGDPYIIHPLAVAMSLATDLPFDDYCVAAGLLHDVVEDNTDVTVGHIRSYFGETLATIVDGVTKMQHEFESREVGHAENFRKLVLSMASDMRVILVKFADRLHNMRTLKSLGEEKQLKIASETLELYAPLAHRFGLYALKNEFEDLSLKILSPEEYYDISKGLKAKKKQRREYITRFIDPVKAELEANGFDFEIYGRPKHIYSIFRKMRAQDKTLDEIFDLLAIRIILDSSGKKGKEDCWRVYSIITDLYQPLPERFRDFISVPKSNGYRSLHTTVIGPDVKRIEVQIRTRDMHQIAEFGVAAHWRYKDDGQAADGELEGRYAWARELLDNPHSEHATEFVAEFHQDIVGEEIYLFTPKGDLLTLPKGATPVDFAFRIHTQVGLRSNGAKVNGRVVPLSHKLESGDQVEIMTSAKKTPNPDWMKFVVTQKAKSRIRHWINEERRESIQAGREAWEKRAHKAKLEISDQVLNRFAAKLKFPNTQHMFYEIGQGLFDVRELVQLAKSRVNQPHEDGHKETTVEAAKFITQAQEAGTPALMIFGEQFTGLASTYASCCNPIPGDPVFGYLSRTGGIRIHRKTCVNARHLYKSQDRIVPVEWSRQKDMKFMVALKIVGEDRVAMISDITDTISKGLKTNIRSITVETTDGVFEGTIVLDVPDLGHLRKLIVKLRRIDGILGVHRLEA